MAHKIVVQDGVVLYTSSDPTSVEVDFTIAGNLNVNNQVGDGQIASSPGSDLYIATSAGGSINLVIPTPGTLQLNGTAGTSGQVLTSQGASAAPIWAPGGSGGSLWQITQYTENGGKNTVDRLWPLPIIGADRQELFSPYRTIIDSDTPEQGTPDYFIATLDETSFGTIIDVASTSPLGLLGGVVYDDFAIQSNTPILSYINTEPQVGGYVSKIVTVPSGFSAQVHDTSDDIALIGESDEAGDIFVDSYITIIGLASNQLASNTIDWQNRYKYTGFYVYPVGMAPVNTSSSFGINLALAFSPGFATTSGILTKFNSTTGATQWRQEISGITDGFMSVGVNNFGGGNSRIFVGVDDTVVGFNEAGTVLWQRRVTLMSGFAGPYRVNQVYGLVGNNWVLAVIRGSDGLGLIGLNANTGVTEFSVSLPDVDFIGASTVYTGNELVVVGKYNFSTDSLILVSMDAVGGYQSAKRFTFASDGDPYTPYISQTFQPKITTGLNNSVKIGLKLQNNFDDYLSLGTLLSVDDVQALGTTNLSTSATGLFMTVTDFTSSSPLNTATLVAGSLTFGTPAGVVEDNPGYTLTNPSTVTTVCTRLAGPLLAPLQPSVEIANGVSIGQLQLTGLIGAPATSKGVIGDVAGMVRFDAGYIYYCYETYTNGTPDIWSRTAATDTGPW